MNYLKMHFTYTGILIFYFITIVWMKNTEKVSRKGKKSFIKKEKKVGVGLENARFHRWEMRSYYNKEVYPFLETV